KDWKVVLSTGTEARMGLGAVKGADDVWLAYTEVAVTEATPVEFFTTSTGLCTVWLNDREVYRREQPVVRGPYPDRCEAALPKGSSRVLVRLTGAKETAEFQLRFRRRSASADHERLTRLALSRAGNPEHGRQILLNAEKSLCLKCHRVGDKGERVGP